MSLSSHEWPRGAAREKGLARTRRRTGQADRPSPPRRGDCARANRANTDGDIPQLIERALHGSGHVANAAAKLTFELASAVTEDEAEEVEGVAWEEMTPAQRAAARAVIDREIVRLAQLEEAPEPEVG
jgi:hypothetical protein